MFAPAKFPAPRAPHPKRLSLLRAVDLTIAVFTLESYGLADIAPGTAAELLAASRPQPASTDCSDSACDAPALRPRLGRFREPEALGLRSRRETSGHTSGSLPCAAQIARRPIA